MLLCEVHKGNTYKAKAAPTDEEKQRLASTGFFRNHPSLSAIGGMKLNEDQRLKFPEYVVYDKDQARN